MRLKAVFEGGSRFTVACRSHNITIDQPKDNGGEDMGMTPPEIMASSLASCIGFYIARYCEQAKIDAAGLTVSCDWQVGGQPKHMESFDVQVNLPNCPDKRRKAIERVAQSCLIHATLGQSPEVRVTLS
ncbi:MAG: OsmC family protein [Ghiorsea sp.]|nr:OsmC family protein [Ghiorsea sp.]